ncbi:3-deoxy-7-phosphoheptulonate synthase [Nocardia aurantia]|uniref:3-deoxy-7-phosphoheptulonate synthase n=1 Tax=Nocardia aurantia TaxID=2585199 RepID=UPI001297FEA9
MIVTYPAFPGRTLPAAQQPEWDAPDQVANVRTVLATAGALIEFEQVVALRRALAAVSAGSALVLQAGDCAEDPNECTRPHIAAKAGLVHRLADLLAAEAGLPVLRVGRIAGQFTKPRSQPIEQVGDVVLPAYRGHMVNAPEFDADSRRPDPLRMLQCFMAAREAIGHLGRLSGPGLEDRVWTSHEALLLDYEQPLLRGSGPEDMFLGSTHWPWIGERTRRIDGAHVDLLSRVTNPVACKIGPTITPAELLELCHRLDPEREPGRLTLIVRMGADTIEQRLPALARAVRDDGHPVLWLSDPMHGNTIKLPGNRKTRLVATVVAELRRFRSILADAGVAAHGLHLEATPHPVGECLADADAPVPAAAAATLCDPRLNPEQAAEVVAAWSAERLDVLEALTNSE